MEVPKEHKVPANKMVQTTMNTFALYRTEEERLQAVVDRINATGHTLLCYVCNGQIVTDLD
mgnify:CR=1 FL=1